jgi:hypothetical protein
MVVTDLDNLQIIGREAVILPAIVTHPDPDDSRGRGV